MKMNKYLVFVIVIVVLVALDQITKIYIHTEFQYGESRTVIADFFNLTYVRNEGAAFGIFRESSEKFRHLFFLAIPPIAVLIILGYLRATPQWDKVQILALSAIAGGALGNYVDRIRFGYVVDFLDFHYKEVYHYPAFNIADSAIVSGVAVLFLLTIRDMRREKAKSKNAQTL